MLERLGKEARSAVSLAGDEAYTLGHDHIGTEHLLIGILGQKDSAAADALVAAGAPLVSVREKVVEALASRTAPMAAGTAEDLQFTPRANRALDRANRLSLRMGSDLIECDHILLSVLDVEGTAGQVLRGLGVDPETVRHALLTPSIRIERPFDSKQTASKTEAPGPLCGGCGSSVETSLACRSVAAGSEESVIDAVVFYCGVCGTTFGAARS